ncbi:MAG TPA: hypothetical protein VGF14_06520, partial [Alphaproteobacteria bacterium]
MPSNPQIDEKDLSVQVTMSPAPGAGGAGSMVPDNLSMSPSMTDIAPVSIASPPPAFAPPAPSPAVTAGITARRRIGDHLTEAGVITHDQLNIALKEKQRT